MSSTTASWLTRGRPRQFMVIAENRRCSILFHLEVPGGKWQQVTRSPASSANRASSTFHNRFRQAFEPPASEHTNNRSALGYMGWPIVCHHRRSDCTANEAVSWSEPTRTHPALAPTSKTPEGTALPPHASGQP